MPINVNNCCTFLSNWSGRLVTLAVLQFEVAVAIAESAAVTPRSTSVSKCTVLVFRD